jgi:hypothetical protein
MELFIENDFVTCVKCSFKFDRRKENKHCSNCIVCTGCEIYYCPQCDEEIIITPIKPIYQDSKQETQSSVQKKLTT